MQNKIQRKKCVFSLSINKCKFCEFGLELAKKLDELRKLPGGEDWIEFIGAYLLFISSFASEFL